MHNFSFWLWGEMPKFEVRNPFGPVLAVPLGSIGLVPLPSILSQYFIQNFEFLLLSAFQCYALISQQYPSQPFNINPCPMVNIIVSAGELGGGSGGHGVCAPLLFDSTLGQGCRHQILIGGAGHTGHTLIIYDFFGAQCTFVIFLRLSVFFRLGRGGAAPVPIFFFGGGAAAPLPPPCADAPVGCSMM